MISIKEKGFFHYKYGLYCRYNKENAIFRRNTPESLLCPFRMSTSHYWEIKSALTSSQSRRRKPSVSFCDTQHKLRKQQEGWHGLYICMNETTQIRHQFGTYYMFLTLLSNGAWISQIQNERIKRSICCVWPQWVDLEQLFQTLEMKTHS